MNNFLQSLTYEQNHYLNTNVKIQNVILGVVSTEPAAKILKPLRDISSPEKEKVTFECEVSRANADVKWFKVLVI